MISNTKRVALYARVSTEEQTSNFSLAAQLELLRKHASDNGFTVFNEYVDGGYSGTVLERPAFQKMLHDARDREFQLILVYRLDRFFRNNRALLTVTEELERYDVGIKSITEPFDTSNHLGKFILSLFGSLAQLERDTFMERSKMGRLRRAREGYYSGANPTKFGYRCTEDRKQLEICPEEAEVVKLVFKWYCEADSSLVQVAKRLNKLGYKTRENGEWKGDGIHEMIRDPIYMGKWYANRYGRNGKRKPRKDWIEVSVPAIVSENMFDSAQSLLVERRNYTTRNVKYQYLLQGLIKCGDCGNPVKGTADRQRIKKAGKVYGPYFNLYYRCTHFVRNIYKKIVKCNLRYMQTESLDPIVWKEIENLLANPKMIARMVRQQNKRGPEQIKNMRSELARLEARLKALGKEEFRMLEAYRQNIINLEQLQVQMGQIKADMVKLSLRRGEIVDLLAKGDKGQVEKAIDYIVQLKKGLKNFTFESKKEILHLLNTRVIANVSGVIDIYCTVPSSELRFSEQCSNSFFRSPSEQSDSSHSEKEKISTRFLGENPNVVSLLPSEQSTSLPRPIRNGISLHFQTKILPHIRRNLLGGMGVKKYYGDAGQLVPVLFGLPPELIKLIDIESRKQKSKRSNISRKIVDSYWLDCNKKKIIIPLSQPNQKHPILGLKTVSITIRRDQAAWLRSMAETTGRSISEMGRNALESYFSKRDQQ